jgi:hypothetical protein
VLAAAKSTVSGGHHHPDISCYITGICPFNFPAMIPLWMYPLAITPQRSDGAIYLIYSFNLIINYIMPDIIPVLTKEEK